MAKANTQRNTATWTHILQYENERKTETRARDCLLGISPSGTKEWIQSRYEYETVHNETQQLGLTICNMKGRQRLSIRYMYIPFRHKRMNPIKTWDCTQRQRNTATWTHTLCNERKTETVSISIRCPSASGTKEWIQSRIKITITTDNENKNKNDEQDLNLNLP
jgi:hypothetical protein